MVKAANVTAIYRSRRPVPAYGVADGAEHYTGPHKLTKAAVAQASSQANMAVEAANQAVGAAADAVQRAASMRNAYRSQLSRSAKNGASHGHKKAPAATRKKPASAPRKSSSAATKRKSSSSSSRR